MRVFLPALEIGYTEGFTPKNDILNRGPLGKRLTNLIEAGTDPLVLAVDGQWGSGKTTFLKMWAGELRKLGFPVVYFDAFENDYIEDAFVAIAGQIVSLAQQKNKEGQPEVQRFIGAAKRTGKVLARSALKIGVKVATLGALDSTELESMADDLSGEASSLTDKYIGELLTKQEEQKNVIAAFREALGDLPRLLTDRKPTDEPSIRPLVFVIDELDRCKPPFALELLERVKHFFAAKNVHFVFGVNLDQLANSVSFAYGGNIDARKYLEKFLHLTINLVDPQRHANDRTIKKFSAHLTKAHEFDAADQETVTHCVRYIEHVAERQRLSLRSIERVFSLLAITLASKLKNELLIPPILAGLCVAKVEKPSLFLRAKIGELTYEEVDSFLGFQYASVPDGKPEPFAENWWKYCLTGQDTPNYSYGDILVRYSIALSHIVPHHADMIDRLSPPD